MVVGGWVGFDFEFLRLGGTGGSADAGGTGKGGEVVGGFGGGWQVGGGGGCGGCYCCCFLVVDARDHVVEDGAFEGFVGGDLGRDGFGVVGCGALIEGHSKGRLKGSGVVLLGKVLVWPSSSAAGLALCTSR